MVMIDLTLFTLFLSAQTPADYYVAGIESSAKTNSLVLKWYSDASNASFRLVFSSNLISSLETLNSAAVQTNIRQSGFKSNESETLFQYGFEMSGLPEGSWYSGIFPDRTNLVPDDFSPQQSYTTVPLSLSGVSVSNSNTALPLKDTNQATNTPVWSSPAIETHDPAAVYAGVPGSVVTNWSGPVVLKISFSAGASVFRMSWSVSPNDSPDLKFNIYRTPLPIRSVEELSNLEPYRVVWNDFVLEESAPVRDVSWVYTVLVNDYAVILPGSNQVRYPQAVVPVSVPVVREVYERKRINTNTYRP